MHERLTILGSPLLVGLRSADHIDGAVDGDRDMSSSRISGSAVRSTEIVRERRDSVDSDQKPVGRILIQGLKEVFF